MAKTNLVTNVNKNTKNISDLLAKFDSYQTKEDMSLNTMSKEVVGAVNELDLKVKANTTNIDLKQNKTDDTLNTTDKTIVGAVNENKANIDTINITLSNKVDTSELSNYYNKGEIDSKLSTTFTRKVVNSYGELPPTGEDNVIYLVKDDTNSNYYTEYLWNTDKQEYEKIGDTKVDLSNYYNKTEVDDALNLKQDKTDNGLNTAEKTVQGAINELKTLTDTLKAKINELINQTPTTARVLVTSSDDGLNFTIPAFDGVDKKNIEIYIMGVKAFETEDYTISGQSLTLLEKLEENQYIDYVIRTVTSLA